MELGFSFELESTVRLLGMPIVELGLDLRWSRYHKQWGQLEFWHGFIT